MAYSSKFSSRRPYSAGHYEFSLDGSSVPGYINNVSGGVAKGSIISETVGPALLQFKHVGTVEIEPISVELGMSMSKPILEWIRASWERRFERKNGVIRHADSRYESQIEQHFTGALITETTFPALGNSSENAYLKLSLLPEGLEMKNGDKQSIAGIMPTSGAQYLWNTNSFRLNIDGLDCSNVKSIESFSVKQHVKKLYIGRSRFPEIEPAAIEFSNISIEMSAAYADDFMKWHNDYIVKGAKESEMEKQGAIEFLSNDRSKTLFSVDLVNIGISSFSIVPAAANAEKIKSCKVELYVENMKLNYSDAIS